MCICIEHVSGRFESTKQKCETAFSEPTHHNKLGFTQSALNSTPHLWFDDYVTICIYLGWTMKKQL